MAITDPNHPNYGQRNPYPLDPWDDPMGGRQAGAPPVGASTNPDLGTGVQAPAWDQKGAPETPQPTFAPPPRGPMAPFASAPQPPLVFDGPIGTMPGVVRPPQKIGQKPDDPPEIGRRPLLPPLWQKPDEPNLPQQPQGFSRRSPAYLQQLRASVLSKLGGL